MLTVERQGECCQQTRRDVCLEAHTPVVHSRQAAPRVSVAWQSVADPEQIVYTIIIINTSLLLSIINNVTEKLCITHDVPAQV